MRKSELPPTGGKNDRINREPTAYIEDHSIPRNRNDFPLSPHQELIGRRRRQTNPRFQEIIAKIRSDSGRTDGASLDIDPDAALQAYWDATRGRS